MAATSAREGRIVARLSELPLELRQAVAHELAKSWRLRGIDYAIFMLAASSPRGEKDAVLEVAPEKYELVMAGRRPPGPTPEELRIPPLELTL